MSFDLARRPAPADAQREPGARAPAAGSPVAPATPRPSATNDALGGVLARVVDERAAGPRTLARFTTAEIRSRATEINVERGTAGPLDLGEARAQLEATKRETDRRAAAKVGSDEVTSMGLDADMSQVLAEALSRSEIAREFTCDRMADWSKIIFSRPLWRMAGMDKALAAKLTKAQNHAAKLISLLTGPDLKQQRKEIVATESAIDQYVAAAKATDPQRCDLLVLFKRYTLGHERKKLAIAERIGSTYGMRLDSMQLVKANKQSYGAKKLSEYISMMEPEVFSLDELEGIESVLKRYAPVLGKNRPKKYGKQTLTSLGRAKYGIDFDGAGVPERDPDTRGESFSRSKVVGMYDEGSRGTQFDTGMKQFRGTLAHELSHALIENIKHTSGDTMLERYCAATGVWTDPWTTPHQQAGNQATWQAMVDAGQEPPITTYGASNGQEDLADAIKFLFENPAKLKADCPKRYTWIVQNLNAFFDAAWQTTLPAVP